MTSGKSQVRGVQHRVHLVCRSPIGTQPRHRQGGGDGVRGEEHVRVAIAKLAVEVPTERVVRVGDRGGRTRFGLRGDIEMDEAEERSQEGQVIKYASWEKPLKMDLPKPPDST